LSPEKIKYVDKEWISPTARDMPKFDNISIYLIIKIICNLKDGAVKNGDRGKKVSQIGYVANYPF
jgi:hypothetical protein